MDNEFAELQRRLSESAAELNQRLDKIERQTADTNELVRELRPTWWWLQMIAGAAFSIVAIVVLWRMLGPAG